MDLVYGLLLRLYPPEYRAAYGDLMLTHARDQWREARSGGFAARVRLAGLLLADFAASLLTEHVEASDFLPRFGGMACIMGGMLWGIVHTPLLLRAYRTPLAALLLMLVGLLAWHACWVQRVGGAGWAGWALASGGLLTVGGGYVAALLTDWGQTGLPTVLGLAAVAVGMVAYGFATIQPPHGLTAGSAAACAVGLLGGAQALWVLVFFTGAASGALLPVAGLIALAILFGGAWVALGLILWKQAATLDGLGRTERW